MIPTARMLGLWLAMSPLGAAGCDHTSPEDTTASSVRSSKASASSSVPASARGRPSSPDRIAPLRAFESRARLETDFESTVPWSSRSGADPFGILELDDGSSLGILRGSDHLVAFADGRAGQRLVAPARPTGFTPASDGGVWLAGEGTSKLFHYRRDAGTWILDRRVLVEGVAAIRDVAAGPRSTLLLADRHRGAVLQIDEPGEATDSVSPRRVLPCAGALSVDVVGDHLIANCMLDRTVAVVDLRRPARSSARIVHDGPMWAVDAVETDEGLMVAVAGVEDHPLDRTEGFGFVDSFAWLYDVRTGGAQGEVRKVLELDVSQHHVVTPKAIRLRTRSGGHDLVVSGYGSDRLLGIRIAADGSVESLRTRRLVPGISSFIGDLDEGFAASPLMDAWVRWSPSAVEVLPEPSTHEHRSSREKLGEALAFTTLMAPWNESHGMASRFTCETCHFEGTVDGRTHYTGRGEVHAKTKPLLGLFENRPHFTRALDRTMAQMVHNEFRVANKGSGTDPWFSLAVKDFPWLRHLGIERDVLEPLELRASLMAFLMAHGHDRNPATLGRDAFSNLEAEGARLFAKWCETCHQARLVTDDPTSRIDASAWEADIFDGGHIVWARARRYRTGVEPYVHDEGARVTSLRRLYLAKPYFTNGNAKSIDDVLADVVLGDEVLHAGTPTSSQKRLTPDQRRALGAFLDLL